MYGFVDSIARAWPDLQLHYLPAEKAQLPFPCPTNVTVCRPAKTARGAQVLIGTLDKLGDALERGDLETVGCLIVDEAYQADSARYYRAAPIADVHLLVGDPGQIDPFANTPEAMRYRGLPEDPVRTAVDVVLENHPDTPVYRLPITRRLDARALPLARAFYEPDHHFDAAVASGVRELTFGTALVRDRRVRELDATLRAAGTSGIAHLELPAGASLVADPEVVDVIATMASRALDPALAGTMRCERNPAGNERLGPTRIAIGASHREQVRALRRALRERGHPEVVAQTANKLQGAEFDLVICWHPLSGLTNADVFHLEAGRMCVLATRHRHACVVVGRASDREAPATVSRHPARHGWARTPSPSSKAGTRIERSSRPWSLTGERSQPEIVMATIDAAERRAVAAAKYRPEQVQLLLVAEAPPAALNRYFYFEDVRDQDSLFRHVVRSVAGRRALASREGESARAPSAKRRVSHRPQVRPEGRPRAAC